jgi:hypothetical protein
MPRLVQGAGRVLVERVGILPHDKSGRLAKRTRRCPVCGAASYERCHRERRASDGAVEYVPLKSYHPGR